MPESIHGLQGYVQTYFFFFVLEVPLVKFSAQGQNSVI